jgi:carboxypeptidase Q
MIRVFFIILSGLIFSNEGAAQSTDEISDQIIRSALADQRGYKWLKELCDIGPRLSGYPDSYKAIEWAQSIMQQAGFDSVWLQPVMVPYWERGSIESAKIISGGKFKDRELSVVALGGSIGTAVEGISGVVVKIDSFSHISDEDIDIKNKIVFYNEPYDRGMVNTFAAYGKAVKQRTRGAIEAAKRGAIGVIVRSVTSLNDNVPHTGVMSYNDSIPKIPAVAIGVRDAELLSLAMETRGGLEIEMKLSCVNHKPKLSYNVIGEIFGKERPQEIIVIGAHFDAWDKGHGAHDDGAGCVQAIEVLDLIKRMNLRPKRTIRCVLFMDEEQRQSGARAYGTLVDSLKQTHIAAIEADRGAFMPRGFSVTADSLIIDKMQTWLPVLRGAGIEWIKKGGSGADISKIKNAKALIGFVPDIQRYFDYHHSANDTFDKVHPREMELGSAAMAILTWLLSEEGI